jgi:putative redox protein
MDASVTWKEGLAFSGTAGTGFSINLDADQEAGGKNTGFLPLELMALSLAGCTAMDVISILQKKRQVVTAFNVEVHADRAEQHPRVFTRASILYHVYGEAVDEAAVLRAIELSARRYCPAQGMLNQVFPIELQYRIYEAQSGAPADLVAEGVYQVNDAVNSRPA